MPEPTTPRRSTLSSAGATSDVPCSRHTATSSARGPIALPTTGAPPLASLLKPHEWCIRAFEANPALWPALDARATHHDALSPPRANLRIVHAAISDATSEATTQSIVQYAPNASWGSSATTFAWDAIHAVGPMALGAPSAARVPSFALRDVVREMVRVSNGDAEIAVRLDVEGAEFAMLEDLVREPDLLCAVSFFFIEFHSLHVNLTKHGLREGLKDRIHALMERPLCKTQLQWRSLWASCGDEQRFLWRKQVRERAAREAKLAKSSAAH